MGGKSSKMELQRSKSRSSFGRSSQRFLFQKSRLQLNKINRALHNLGPDDYDKIKTELEAVEKSLQAVSESVKEKNREKYEETLKCFRETSQKLNEKMQPIASEAPPSAENGNGPSKQELVEADVEKHNEDVEMRNRQRPGSPKSPTVKFGVQVMPANQRVSQELLRKRNTLPVSEVAKAEFENIRSMARASDEGSHGTDEQSSNFASLNLNRQNNIQLTNRRIVDTDALHEIELISKGIDTLENRLKYFEGKKSDVDYIELNSLFIKSLIKLDNVHTHGDLVARQERKIAIQRIQELIKILECLVHQEEPVMENESSDEDGSIQRAKQEENISADGKPIVATAI